MTRAPAAAPRLDAEGNDASFDPLRDRVLLGARVRTLDPGRPSAAAVAIRGGRVLAVGSEAEVRAAAAPDAELLDLGGAVVLPGFHDAHVHLAYHGLELAQVRLEDTTSLEEAAARVRARAATLPPGTWVLGSGFAVGRWGVDRPDRARLDEAVPDHPVLLRSQDHHSALANGRALALAGVAAGTPDPAAGTIARRADGAPSGYLQESAVGLVARAVPEPSPEAFRAALAGAGRHLASLGVTTVHTMAYEPATHWRAVADAASGETYPLRVWACVPHADIEAAAALGLATGQGGGRFAIGGAKFFVDGALGSLSAWMLEPYGGTDEVGAVVDGPEVLHERVPLAVAAGLVPVTHAIGDAAVRAVLDAYEASAPAWRAAGLRPRVEHAQHVHADDVARLGRLGLVASMQPLHLHFDAPTIHARLQGREARAYPIRSLAAAGAILAFGSDTPVAPPDPLGALRVAVGRTGMEDLVVGAAEAIDAEAAVRAHTAGAAAAIGRAGRSGVLARGADADLTVLSGDPTAALDDDLRVLATAVGGRFTFA